MTDDELQRWYADRHRALCAWLGGGTFVECKAELARRYEAAVVAKIAAGPEHENDPDCECDVCYAERELYFENAHFWDDVPPELKPRRDVGREETRYPPIEGDLPF